MLHSTLPISRWHRTGRRLLGALALGLAATAAAPAQTLVWQENFDGATINAENWTFDFGDGCERGLCGWGNQELQYYTSRPENARLDQGSLVIEARKENFQTRGFTSARLKTLGRVQFKYGTLEARIKVPNLKNGLWPAFWLLGATGTWPASGETDIMEMGSKESYPANVNNWAGGAMHWNANGQHEYAVQTYKGTSSLTDDYHVYKLVWTAQAIKMYIDNNEYFSKDISNPAATDMEEFHKAQFILLNMAVGGVYTGIDNANGITAALPAQMLVDYVRLYQNPGDELYLGKDNAYAGKFGVYTEQAAITNKLQLGTNAELFYWNNLTNITPAPAAYEGSEVLAVQAKAGDWFGMGFDHAPVNLINFAQDGKLNVQFKTTYAGQFKMGVKSGHGESWINFPAGSTQYGLVRDGQWHQISIPLSAFNQPNVGMNIDLNAMTGLLMFAGDPATANAEFFFDDIYVGGGVAANPAPTVSLTAPTEGAVITTPASLTLTATAADENGTVAKVEFFQGTTKLGEATTAPYSYTWAGAPAGVYQLTARATDNEGSATTSRAVTVFVAAAGNAAPTVALTSPAANASFFTPASITLTANATDSDGSIYKVDFYQGTTLLGTVSTAPYTYVWTGAVAGAYSLTARATDNGGAVTTSAAVAITVADPIKPTVALTSPLTTDTFTAPATLNLTATAADANGTVTKVEFFEGSTKLGEDATAPYTYEWQSVPAGEYSLTSRATDNDGNTTTSAAVAVEVKALACTGVAASGDYRYEVFSTAGNVTYTFRPLGAVAGGNLALIFIQEGGIGAYPGYPMTRKANGDFTFTRAIADGVATSFYFTYQAGAGGPERNSADKPHRYTAGQSCDPNNPANEPPTVALTAPTATGTYVAPATITLTATAADTDGTVAKVEFFQGATKLGEATAAPFTYQWTGVTVGQYELTAKATDNAGASTVSDVVRINVTLPAAPGYCNTTPDYSFKAESSGADVTFTFHPIGSVAGGNLALIYIQEGGIGAYPGYSMTKQPNGDFTFTRAIASGTALSVYFTYQAGAGGPERNTAATPYNFTAGQSCSVTTGTQSVRPATAFTLAPNPARNQVTVAFAPTTTGAYQLAVYDLRGRLVEQLAPGTGAVGQTSIRTLPVGNYANGVYLVKLQTARGVAVQRLVVSH
ncbi:family 16 glycosylhydrolase [Hymenobacter sp. NST-14]|uniref:Ig-like domain-containing protein n=1 Tax=Hymenobacter piscis TaxID=2839984 RepID=UPI001C022757|nr:Ig-like domain-containing protein [Hymenobacter piscis]MBT9393380.1 family 16 glycosylhydrolase [Hymenobacter piscis]